MLNNIVLDYGNTLTFQIEIFFKLRRRKEQSLSEINRLKEKLKLKK